MAKQMMFYEKIAPISVERHKDWSVAQGKSYGFAAGANAVPMMCAEFQSVATDFPIVFGKTENGFAPVVVLGLEQGKSLFVDGKGKWTGDYIPAFVRRYPFVFAQSDDAKTFTLCLDEAYGGCDAKGKKGERLFGEDGKPTEFVNKALEFSKSFETEQRKTSDFTSLLDANGLLEPMQAAIVMPDGAKRALTGFHVVSREKLKALDPKIVSEFFNRDVFELVYYHLLSLRNMEKLRQRMI